MYKFAKYLTDYMNEKNISYRKAAMAINIDRTQLRRYAIGERLPKDEEIVDMIAKGIKMTEEETNLLFEYYKRSKMGEQKYRWYKTFGKILNGSFRANVSIKNNHINVENVMKNAITNADTNWKMKKNVLRNINSKIEIDKIIKWICRDAKNIKIMLQTRIYDFYESIYEAVACNKICNVEHIVQLNNINIDEDISDLRIFENVYRLMICGSSYKIYYTYDNYDIDMTCNYIISDNGMVVFNTFGDNAGNIIGIYTNKKEIISYYENMFSRLRIRSYIYGYSGGDIKEDNFNIKYIIENKVCEMRTGMYKNGRRKGMWIKDSSSGDIRDVYIEEDNIVYYYNMFTDDYYCEDEE